MESHGAPASAHMTKATRCMLGESFPREERGTISIKGDMRTWSLSCRPDESTAIAAASG